MAVLYRKYRPQTFAQVLGQKHVVQTLKNQVKSGSIAHAYLFTGGRGVGKTSIARILAKAVNCEQESKDQNPKSKKEAGDACGECNVCKQIEAGQFMDLVEIDAASNTGVDNIRDLIDHVKFSPSVGTYKVFIIDEVHMLSKGAFNALLKTLEEPPKHAIFVLATTEINKVPATIISRTQRFDFVSPSLKDLSAHLSFIVGEEKLKVDPEIIGLISSNAQGSTRDALSLLDKVLSLGDNPSLEDCLRLLGVTDISLCEQLFGLIVQEHSAEVPAFFSLLMERGVDFTIFNKDFLEYLRKALIEKATGIKNSGLASDHAEKLSGEVERLSLQEIILMVRLFLKSFKDLAGSPSPEIPLLLAALEACSRKRTTQPAGPIAASTHVAARVPAPRQQAGQAASSVSLEEKLEPAPVGQFAFTHVLEPSAAVPAVADQPLEMGPVDTSVAWMDIAGKWPAVLNELRTLNAPLANLLKNSPVQKVDQGKIFLGVKFLFHKQNLESQKNLKVICDAIEKVTGKTIGLCAVIVKDEAVSESTPAAMLDDALRILGGELVD